jgi:hypothetical protein
MEGMHEKLERRFARLARAVRTRLAARSVLLGGALGMFLGALVAAGLWWQRLGNARPWAAGALALVGAALGYLAARRRRLSDSEIALFLDARFGSAETITTALELSRDREITPAAVEVVQASALRTLEESDPKLARPRLYQRLHWLAPLGAAVAIAVSVAPLPPAPPPPAKAPGSERIKLAKLAGLEQIEALEQLAASTPEERERLRRIAEAARKLKAELAQGMEKREALSAVAKLRDDIAAERMKFGDAQNRPGLDAAIAELQRHQGMQRAARALSEGDLVAFDEEMQRIANLAESEDRDAAKQALEEAAKAAKDKGSEALSKALERERKKFEEAQAKAEALRELARELGDSLGQEGQQALQDYGESGSPEAQRKLTESMERALRGLTEEERKRLAENLKKRASSSGGSMQPMTRQELEELAKKLAEKDTDQQLEEQLRELAKRDPSADAERERGLGEADRGGADAQRGLGMPLPSPGQPGGGKPGAGKQGSGPKQDSPQKNGQGGPGGKKDEGQGSHEGETKELEGDPLRSKANAKLLPGASMHGATLGRTPGRAGESANQLGAGSLGAVGPTEIGAVEGTDIPEEYREQVGRYFEP